MTTTSTSTSTTKTGIANGITTSGSSSDGGGGGSSGSGDGGSGSGIGGSGDSGGSSTRRSLVSDNDVVKDEFAALGRYRVLYHLSNGTATLQLRISGRPIYASASRTSL